MLIIAFRLMNCHFFLAQVTTFKCAAISLAIVVSHAVANGSSTTQFVVEWAPIALGDTVPQTLPFLDWRVFLDDNDDSTGDSNLFNEEDVNATPPLLGQSNNIEERKKKIAKCKLKLSREEVENLKIRANYQYNRSSRDIHQPPTTRYEFIATHVWRTARKVREHQPEQPTAVWVCVDTRNRTWPPLPPSYFGNATLDVMAVTTSGELITKPLSYGCNVIRKVIEKATSEYIKPANKFLKNQKDLTKFQNLNILGRSEGLFYGNSNLNVVSWLLIPLYTLDFGWGKGIYMGLGIHDFDGDYVISPSPHGDGSLIVAMCLQEPHMEAFKKYFYEDIVTPRFLV